MVETKLPDHAITLEQRQRLLRNVLPMVGGVRPRAPELQTMAVTTKLTHKISEVRMVIPFGLSFGFLIGGPSAESLI